MPFGNSDRESLRQISNQLGQLAADLAAVKQQVGDQQHTIDQTRQDTTAAITTGLAEIRAIARDGINRATDTVTGPLAQVGNELVAIRGSINQLDGQLKAQAAAPAVAASAPPPEPEPAGHHENAVEPAPDPQPAEQPTEDEDGTAALEVLRAAAGISAAELHAHRDTWEFLVKFAGRDQHFHLPGKVDCTEGRVIAYLSGPSLVAILTSLDEVRADPDAGTGTQVIAHHLHARIGTIVAEVARDPSTSTNANPVKILIDDRAAPTEADDQPTGA